MATSFALCATTARLRATDRSGREDPILLDLELDLAEDSLLLQLAELLELIELAAHVVAGRGRRLWSGVHRLGRGLLLILLGPPACLASRHPVGHRGGGAGDRGGSGNSSK